MEHLSKRSRDTILSFTGKNSARLENIVKKLENGVPDRSCINLSSGLIVKKQHRHAWNGRYPLCLESTFGESDMIMNAEEIFNWYGDEIDRLRGIEVGEKEREYVDEDMPVSEGFVYEKPVRVGRKRFSVTAERKRYRSPSISNDSDDSYDNSFVQSDNDEIEYRDRDSGIESEDSDNDRDSGIESDVSPKTEIPLSAARLNLNVSDDEDTEIDEPSGNYRLKLINSDEVIMVDRNKKNYELGITDPTVKWERKGSKIVKVGTDKDILDYIVTIPKYYRIKYLDGDALNLKKSNLKLEPKYQSVYL